MTEPDWLAAWEAGGMDPPEAAALFAGLPALAPEELVGRWRGRSLPTGHPLDGLLEGLGWHGKSIEDPERVHPLVFRLPSGRLLPLEPALMPAGLVIRWPGIARSAALRAAFARAAPLLRARRPGARLALRDFGGRRSAALIYHRQPITDHLRRAGPDHVLGLMQHEAMDRPFLFLLARESPAPA